MTDIALSDLQRRVLDLLKQAKSRGVVKLTAKDIAEAAGPAANARIQIVRAAKMISPRLVKWSPNAETLEITQEGETYQG